MTALQGVFLFAGALILFGAYMVVTRNNLIHAALYLVVALFGVAVLYVLLDAGFLAMIQVLVYIGAIAILMIFAVMLTRGDFENLNKLTNYNAVWFAVMAFLFGSVIVVLLALWPSFNSVAADLDAEADAVVDLGRALVSPNAYVIPFEVASVMLLAALIGALVVARPSSKGGNSK